MKSSILLFALSLFISFSSFGQEEITREFDPKEEAVCHREYKVIGCVSKDGTELPECIEKRQEGLTKACQSLHKDKQKKPTRNS